MDYHINILYNTSKNANGDSMNLFETLNKVLENAGVDIGSVLLIIFFFGSLIFYAEDYKRGIITTMLLMFVVAMLYNFLGLSMSIPILLIITCVALLTISLYFEGRKYDYA